MRKYAAFACAVLLTVGMCACGKKTEPERHTINPPTIVTTTTTAPVVNYTEEPGKAPLKLIDATSFSDGVAFVRYLDEDGGQHNAAINTAGDVLFEMPAEMPMEGEGYKNGIRVVGNVIYDKTGAVIASPQQSGYDTLLTGNCGGYVLAIRTVTAEDAAETAPVTDATTLSSSTTSTTTGSSTTATGEEAPATPAATLQVGVLNNAGEWKPALSADHPIAQIYTDAMQFQYVSGDTVRVYPGDGTYQYYHFVDNTLTPEYEHYLSVGQQSEEEAIGIYQMTADGSKKMVLENIIADYFLPDKFIGRSVTISIEPGVDPVYGAAKLYDYEGNELMDLSAYTRKESQVYYEMDHLVMTATDEVGTRLLVVLNKDGQPAFEPLVLGMRDTFYRPDESGFVVESYTADGVASYRHYDYSGNVTEYSDVTSFAGFYEGLAVVTLRGDTQQYYYINHRAEIVLR